MRSHEFLREDDYWGDYNHQESKISAEDLNSFVQKYVEQYLGEPHSANVDKHFDTMKIFISIPKQDPRRNPRRKQTSPDDKQRYAEMAKEDWRETATDLIDELRRAELGDFELDRITDRYVELVAPYDLYESGITESTISETTTAGGIATVVGGMAPAFTRNASIYGNDKKKKKKPKAGKYVNSKQD